MPSFRRRLAAAAAVLLTSTVAAFTCTDDWDCSLAGVCTDEGLCVCDAWSSGADCSYLNFLPVDRSRLGYVDPDHSSWGGNAVLGPDGRWHLYAAEIACNAEDTGKRCGLGNWVDNSQVVHATSDNPDGPYVREELTLGQEAHNPTVQVSPVDGTWHLYAIRAKDGPTFVVTSTDGGTSWSDPADVSPYCNPGPVLHDDGTMTLFYRDDADLPKPTCSTESIGVQRCSAPTGGCDLSDVNPILNHTAEDPSVFIDGRGNWHMLMNALPYLCVPKLHQGGHAWSRDGVTWSEPRVGAYNTTVEFTDGTDMVCERRERPQMVLDDKGEPMVMFSGVTGCPKLKEWPEYKGVGTEHDCFTLAQMVPRSGDVKIVENIDDRSKIERP